MQAGTKLFSWIALLAVPILGLRRQQRQVAATAEPELAKDLAEPGVSRADAYYFATKADSGGAGKLPATGLVEGASGYPFNFDCVGMQCKSAVSVDLTSSAFGADFSVQTGKGLMLVDYSMQRLSSGSVRYSGVYKENHDGRGWSARRGMTQSAFLTEDTQRKSAGYRLIDVEVYQSHSTWLYAGIWVENIENRAYTFSMDVSKSDYYVKLNEFKGSYVPVDVDIYEKDGAIRYNIVWVENVGETVSWVLRTDMSWSTFMDTQQQYHDSGYAMKDYESATINGSQRYAALFFRASSYGSTRWAAILPSDLQNQLDARDDEGWRVIDFQAYNFGSQTRYGVVWIENDRAKSQWFWKPFVDQIVEPYVSANSIVGMSVTIVQDGVERYTRGFGNADVARNLTASSHTLFRLASVSKAVGGILGAILDGNNLIDLDSRARDHITVSLPWSHTYTVRETITHRSGIRHYTSPDVVNDASNPHYSTATDALPMLPAASALVNTPGSSSLYSTHAYTFAAAAFEGATGKSIGDLVDQYLTRGADVPSLDLEDNRKSKPKRSQVYWTNGNVATRDDLSWKVLGGGMECSSKDLGSFMDRVLNTDTILSSTQRSKMFEVPDSLSSYSTGFYDRVIDSRTVHTKSGSQTGSSSYVVLCPSLKYTIVVLINQANRLADNIALDIARRLW